VEGLHGALALGGPLPKLMQEEYFLPMQVFISFHRIFQTMYQLQAKDSPQKIPQQLQIFCSTVFGICARVPQLEQSLKPSD